MVNSTIVISIKDGRVYGVYSGYNLSKVLVLEVVLDEADDAETATNIITPEHIDDIDAETESIVERYLAL